jgi:hypothetical protein
MAVGISHQFIGFFGGGVQADRLIGDSRFCPGLRCQITVHRAAGGEHQLLDLVVAAGFQYIGKSHQVTVDIRVRVGDRIAHAGLGGQMEDFVGLVPLHNRGQLFIVFQTDRIKRKAFIIRQPRQSRLLERDIIVIG